MPSAAEELREQIERVVVLMPPTAAGGVTRGMLLDAFMAVFVVDVAGFGGDEDLVSFSDIDEFLRSGFIAPGGLCMYVLAFAGNPIRGGAERTGFCLDGVVCSARGMTS